MNPVRHHDRADRPLPEALRIVGDACDVLDALVRRIEAARLARGGRLSRVEAADALAAHDAGEPDLTMLGPCAARIEEALDHLVPALDPADAALFGATCRENGRLATQIRRALCGREGGGGAAVQ